MNELTPEQKKGCCGCAVVPVVLIAILFAWAYSKDSQRNDRIEAALNGRPDATITAAELLNDKQGLYYNDRVVEVSGVINATSVDTLSVIVYMGAPGSAQTDRSVWCYFGQADGPRVDGLRNGDPITIRGVASTGIMPMLQRCRIVR